MKKNSTNQKENPRFKNSQLTSHSSMSSVSLFPRLTSGVSVDNLVVEQDIDEFFPVFLYNVNSRAIDAINLKDITPGDLKNTFMYSRVDPFFIDPQGKKILAFDVETSLSATPSNSEPGRADVILYQEDASGRLHRLTPVTKKILEGVSMMFCQVLTHPDYQLKEYSDDELHHYFGTGNDFVEEFDFERFEKNFADKSYKGERPNPGIVNNYKENLAGQSRPGSKAEQEMMRKKQREEGMVLVQQSMQNMPFGQGFGPMQMNPTGQQPPVQPQVQMQPPPVQMSQSQPSEPVQPVIDLNTFEAQNVDIGNGRWMISQWGVVFNASNGEVIGTVDRVENGNMINFRSEISSSYVPYIRSKFMTIAPNVKIL